MITPIYAAVLGSLFVFLSFRVIQQRGKHKVLIGEDNSEAPELLRTIRVHANFAEFVPLALLLIFFLESQTNHTILVHISGIALVLGRMLHAYGVSNTNENLRFRQIGMVLTFLVIITSAICILFSYL